MSALLVGVVVHTDPAALHATLHALDAALRPGDRVVLLPDGPDEALAAALDAEPRLRALDRRDGAGPRGVAAAFNRLAAGVPPGVGALLLLENGARPAPDALDRLAAALERPGVGLAGPSTTEAWNEQRALPGGPGGPGDDAGLRESARVLAARHGDAVVDLAPLHSVAEMCLAVSTEALAAVGAADEGFGLGPCWEMEYAARASRAGFASVWVPAAWVHRAPMTPRRRAGERDGFAASRRRYQDRLCGLRLDGRRAGPDDYADHCRGDACPHFAPAGRIAVHLPLPPRVRVVAPPEPLVSAVMPTADRPDWVARAVAYFHRQTHPHRELVVVDDGEGDRLGDLLDHPSVRHVRLGHRHSIGAKRNLGTERAGGEIVVQWDDDDWHSPTRLADQSAALRSGTADVTALRDAVWFDVERWRFRRPTREHHRRLFVGDVHGGTLAFRRAVWERGSRYPDVSLAEDGWFLRDALRRGARLTALAADGRYVYVRHGRNSWSLRPADDGPEGWEDVAEPAELAADRAFYRRLCPAPGATPPRPPLVSAIMPTAGRRAFVPGAVACFLAQRYRATELLVLDDGDDPVADLLPDDPRVRYLPLGRRLLLGQKRNRAVEAARGEIVVHLDDDDWSHPDRVATQVAALADGDAEVCGLARMLWWDAARERAWRYTCPPVRRTWVAGNTLAYRRSTWERSPFPAEQHTGEDTAFVWGRSDRRVRVVDDERLVVGTVHPGNTSPKHTDGGAWTSVDVAEVRRILDAAGAGRAT